MRRYVVRWIEHHSLEVDADSPEEAEEAAMGGDGMTDSSRTYCYAEIESIETGEGDNTIGLREVLEALRALKQAIGQAEIYISAGVWNRNLNDAWLAAAHTIRQAEEITDD